MKTLLNKKLAIAFTILVLCIVISTVNAQNKFPSTGAAGIGTTTPDVSSLLEIKSTSKGLLIPRMTKAQRDAITTPATGLLIYQTNNTPGFYYYNGTAWAAVAPKTAWLLTGNAGTDSSKNFIGTTDAHPLVFRVNNKKSGWIDYKDYQYVNGAGNTSFGYQALLANTTGFANVAIGYNALFSNTTGYYNTATGHSALYSNTTGAFNAANGFQALYFNTTGNNNTGTGEGALYGNISGSNNSALGERAMYDNTTGHDNTATGTYALYFNQSGNYNTANGSFAFRYNITGSYNTGNGYNALYSNNNGNYNTATGYKCLYSNTSGSYNVANGDRSLYYNTTGYYNTANGDGALLNNSTASNNTADGYNALYYVQTGQDNTAMGYQALYSNSDNYNTAVGFRALYTNTSGFNNTSLGIEADVSVNNLVNSTAIGANAVVNASNKIRLGDGGITVVESNAGSWTVSDGRFKNNIQENVKGLEFIKLLKPVTYNFDTKKFQEFLLQNYPDSIKSKRMAAMNKDAMAKSSTILQSGFVAQDVAEAIKKSGYNFNGVHAPENPTDNWSLSYEKLVVPLVKAVQELSKMNDAKDAKIDTLQNQLNELRTLVLSIQQKQQSCSPCNAVSNQSISKSNIVLTDAASLQQNVPNPFNNTTKINYALPQKFISAQIVITDKNGKTLKALNISGSGKSSLNVDASTLAAGAYQYSLVIDGRLIATKQMILAK